MVKVKAITASGSEYYEESINSELEKIQRSGGIIRDVKHAENAGYFGTSMTALIIYEAAEGEA